MFHSKFTRFFTSLIINKYVFTFVAVSMTINTCIVGFAIWENTKYESEYIKVLETKPRVCRVPDIKTYSWKQCTVDEPCLIQKWIFHPVFKTCQPACFQDNRVPVEFKDLPSTRRECETHCGEPCVVTYPNGTILSRPGVCMENIYCDIDPVDSLWQWIVKVRENRCPLPSISCCPRDYLRSSEIPDILRP